MQMEKYIPIFPLNTVLFPGITIELQIFEERYRKMIYSALTSNQNIGIFCIKEGIEAYGPLPVPYEVGTLSKIYEHDPIELLFIDNIIFRISVLGLKKIKLLHYYESSENYLIGNIIPDEEMIITNSIKEENKKEFLQELEKYLKYLNIDVEEPLNTENFILLCHFAIKILNIPLSEKQQLLEYPSFEIRWKETFKILQHKNSIISQLQQLHHQSENHQDNLN
jgi:Lon protease-like protein